MSQQDNAKKDNLSYNEVVNRMWWWYDMNMIMICNAGISSMLMVKKLAMIAEEKRLDLQFSTQSVTQLDLSKADVLLLSPQVSYVRKQLSLNALVYQISSFDYSSLNAIKIIEDIQILLMERKPHETGNSR